MGLDEFLQVFGGFFADCGEAASSKVLLTKICFSAETNSKQGVDSSTRVFQGFGWCRVYDDDIKLW